MGIFSFRRGDKPKPSPVDNEHDEVERDIFNQVFLADNFYVRGRVGASPTTPSSSSCPNSPPRLHKDKSASTPKSKTTKRTPGHALQVPSRPRTSGKGTSGLSFNERKASSSMSNLNHDLLLGIARPYSDRPSSSHSRPSTPHSAISTPWINTHTSFNATFSSADRQLYRPKRVSSSQQIPPVVPGSRPGSNSPTHSAIYNVAPCDSDNNILTSSAAATETSDLSSAILAEDHQLRVATPPSTVSNYSPPPSLSVSPKAEQRELRVGSKSGIPIQSFDLVQTVLPASDKAAGKQVPTPIQQSRKASEAYQVPSGSDSTSVGLNEAPEMRDNDIFTSNHNLKTRDIVNRHDLAMRVPKRRSWAAKIDQLEKSWLEEQMSPRSREVSRQDGERDNGKPRSPPHSPCSPSNLESSRLRSLDYFQQDRFQSPYCDKDHQRRRPNQSEQRNCASQDPGYDAGQGINHHPQHGRPQNNYHHKGHGAHFTSRNGWRYGPQRESYSDQRSKADQDPRQLQQYLNHQMRRADYSPSQSLIKPGTYSNEVGLDGPCKTPGDIAGRIPCGNTHQRMPQYHQHQQLRTTKSMQQLPRSREYSPASKRGPASPEFPPQSSSDVRPPPSLQSAQFRQSPPPATSSLSPRARAQQRLSMDMRLPTLSENSSRNALPHGLQSPSESSRQESRVGGACESSNPIVFQQPSFAGNCEPKTPSLPYSGDRDLSPCLLRYQTAPLQKSPALERGQRLPIPASLIDSKKKVIKTNTTMNAGKVEDELNLTAETGKTPSTVASPQPPPVLDLPQSISTGSLDKATLNSFPMPISRNASPIPLPAAPSSLLHLNRMSPQPGLDKEKDVSISSQDDVAVGRAHLPVSAKDTPFEPSSENVCVELVSVAGEDEDIVADTNLTYTSIMADKEVCDMEKLLLMPLRTPVASEQGNYASIPIEPLGNDDANNGLINHKKENSSSAADTDGDAEAINHNARSFVVPWSPISLPTGDAEPSPRANWPLPTVTILLDSDKDNIYLSEPKISPKRSKSPFTASVYAQDIGPGPYAYDDAVRADYLECLPADMLDRNETTLTAHQLPAMSDAPRALLHNPIEPVADSSVPRMAVGTGTPQGMINALQISQETRTPALDDCIANTLDSRPESIYSSCGYLSGIDSESVSNGDVGDGDGNAYYDVESSSQTSYEYNDSLLLPESIGRARGPSILAEAPAFWGQASEDLLSFSSPHGKKHWNIVHHRDGSETLHEQLIGENLLERDDTTLTTGNPHQNQYILEGRVDKFGTIFI
ncbi:hypothetical protein SEPCBS57363_005674 [Sporothrix epigloea]|uniref:Uncharacterized protein n=1 Tax=Sporothrix epigloea TaxID=1892477 RepID=A0ABP0DYW5_9PEZI